MLSFMTFFLSLGYASLTDILDADGTAEYKEPETIYITNIEITNQGSDSITSGTPSIEKIGFLFMQLGNFSLKRQLNSDPGGWLEIRVTLKNNSGADQYLKAGVLSNNPSNAIEINYAENSQPGTLISKLPPGIGTITFTIQNSNRKEINVNGLQIELDFEPKFDSTHTENIASGIAGQFENILNKPSFTYNGQNIDSTQKLVNAMSSVWNSVDTGGYFGNVGNATQQQKDLIEAMLGENTKMQIGNFTYSVSVLVKNQKINNDNTNDMVLYITADQLDQGGGGWDNGAYQGLNIVPVYALVYINQGNDYVYCDHMFAGEAPVCDLDGKFGANAIGNFNTNLWNSTDYPNLTDRDGQVTENWITADGELDEAYERYLRDLS